jgi:hypothetical protein
MSSEIHRDAFDSRTGLATQAGLSGKVAEISPKEGFLEFARMKPADSG